MTSRIWRPELQSNGSGTRIVLLHPLGGNALFWDPITAYLADFELLKCDFPGHGSSPTIEPGPTIAELADSLADAMRPVGIAHVIGCSLGGLVAQQLAARHPGAVDRLVLVDTVISYPTQMRNFWLERAERARRQGLQDVVSPTVTAWLSVAGIASRPDLVDLVGDLVGACDSEGYALACEELAAVDTSEAIQRVSARTMIVCGEFDGAVFREAACALAERIAGAELRWLPGASHAGPLEMPEQFANMVRTFVGRLPWSASTQSATKSPHTQTNLRP